MGKREEQAEKYFEVDLARDISLKNQCMIIFNSLIYNHIK